MRKILPLSCITMALMLAGCGGSSNSILVEKIDAQVVEDKTYEHTFADLGNQTPVVTGLASNGNVQITTSGFNYVPNANFNGADSATIEVGKTRYTVQFTVTAENDLPTIATTDMAVSATSEIQGQIAVSDVDDENVAMMLKTAPTSGTLTLNADGSFVYKNDDLTLPNLSFEVTLDDGHGETVDFTINLSAAYASNEDKANYYYASEKSHLKQAEARLSEIKDDVLVAQAWSSIAKGYALASLDDQVAAIVENKISFERDRTQLLLELASTYNKLGKGELATTYLDKSLQSMLAYLAEIGTDNMSSADATLLSDISERYRNFASIDNLATAQNAIKFIYSEITTDEETKISGKLVTAQRNIITTLMDHYLELSEDDPIKETTRTNALKELKLFVSQSQKLGYKTKTINELPDQRYHITESMNVGLAVTYAMILQETALAKEYLAKTLSYYADVDYDNNYQYSAHEYADNNLAAYRFPLVTAIRNFSLLYPNADVNFASTLYNFNTDDRADASLRRTLSRELPITQAYARIKQGGTLSEAVDVLKESNPNAAYAQQDMIVKRSVTNHSLANALFNDGQRDLGLQAIEEGLNLLLSTDTLVEKGGIAIYTLGKVGCYRYFSNYDKRGLNNLAKEAAQRCHDEMYVPHYQAYFENGGSPYKDYDPTYVVLVQSDLFFAVGDNAKVVKLLKDTAQYISSFEDVDEQIEYYGEYGHRAMAAGDFQLALSYLEKGKALILQDESLTGSSAIRAFNGFNKFVNSYDYYDSKAFIYSAENELRRRGYSDENYTKYLAQLSAIATAVNEKVVTILKAESASVKKSYGDDVIEALASNRQYAVAQQLISLLELGESDENELLVQISMIQALQEDFPGSAIASVDSDNDGRANFFAIAATDDDKEKTDIELDNDADGDGIADEDDPTPLG
ncbi:Ig-like domain-containing protein [Psychrobium sp. nBUS_13]|uniref:Ig-like domain-containing protein n=1 Tax=Psychrobium sp. nBUS_13 TaxID=3395319 RepID=UPI003EBB0CA3